MNEGDEDFNFWPESEQRYGHVRPTPGTPAAPMVRVKFRHALDELVPVGALQGKPGLVVGEIVSLRPNRAEARHLTAAPSGALATLIGEANRDVLDEHFAVGQTSVPATGATRCPLVDALDS